METVPSISVWKAEEAITFYKENLNAKVEQIIYMKEAPMYKNSPYKDLVMHSRIMIGDSIIYLNDQLDNHVQEVGRNIQFCLNVFKEDEFMKLYNNLTPKSTVERDITEEYWNAKSFSIKDPYDIVWHIFYIMEVEK